MTERMDLEGIMLSEVRERQVPYDLISFFFFYRFFLLRLKKNQETCPLANVHVHSTIVSARHTVLQSRFPEFFILPR